MEQKVEVVEGGKKENKEEEEWEGPTSHAHEYREGGRKTREE